VLQQGSGKKFQNSNSSSPSDPYQFDLDHYLARMTRYVGDAEGENRIFFDALRFAHELHTGQTRKSGAAYISHPCAVAEILAREMQIKDPMILGAALLHDVVEDVPSIGLEDVEDRFGEVVADLVDGCTKLTRHHLDRATLKDLTHSKIFLSASRRLGVLIIKLADRLHNLRTLHYLPLSKRQRIALETVDVYAPIAARFNIFPLKRELYHLALSYLYPRKSKKILHFIREVRNSPQVMELEGRLNGLLAAAPCKVIVRPRAKGLGSYYYPLKRSLEVTNVENHVDFAIIMDTDDALDCYYALGLINTTFPPIPRSMRDFIASPKNNGYRSLHVRVHVGGQNYLIKIRTADMDLWATYGIVHHWESEKSLSDERWQEISELLRNIGEYGGAGPQRKALIRLSETEEIFVYSPKGDIYYLPKDSVVLDFAYRIHSDLGDFCQGAMVNNEWAPPTQLLKDGDTVEIVKSSESQDVDPGLEDLCKTPRARATINRRLQHQRREYARKVGHEILAQELRRHGLPTDMVEREETHLILEFLNLKDISELFARIGQDLLSPHLVLYYLESPRHHRDRPQQLPADSMSAFERNILHMSELDKAIHKFARCCNPYPGQERVVATLSERGATFHHQDCVDLRNRHDLQPQQLLDVTWQKEFQWKHPMTFHLQIPGETPLSLVPCLAQQSSDTYIRNIESTADRNDQPGVRLTIRFRSFEEAERLFRCLPTDRMIVEDYGREEAPGRVHGAHAERPY
jgi:GTP pyrophosphokinase